MSDSLKRQGALTGAVQSCWHRFLDVFEPIRPELYRYCRCLTHNAWDAEDLTQDTLMRAFVTLGTVFHEVPAPRAWLFRVASNLWIDRSRRSRFEQAIEPSPQAGPEPDPRGPREAAGALFGQLSPQERAAVVLKDVFEFSVVEIAQTLSTTPGAVKAALHRGRGRLSEPENAAAHTPAPRVLDAFCNAFNARDLPRMTELLLETASVEIVGLVTEYGRDAPADPQTGSFAGTLAPISIDERGGVPPQLLDGYQPNAPQCEVRAYRGSWLLLFWFDHDQGPMVRTLMTFELAGDRIARVRNYFFSPDVIAEVCAELKVPYHVNGYRYWHDQVR